MPILYNTRGVKLVCREALMRPLSTNRLYLPTLKEEEKERDVISGSTNLYYPTSWARLEIILETIMRGLWMKTK